MQKSDRIVIWWNNTYIFDYWWRKKHNIPFMSNDHKNADAVDIIFEYIEDDMMKKLASNPKEEAVTEEPYVAGSSNIFRTIKQTAKLTKSEKKKISNIKSLDDLKFGDDGKITLR
jgi:hypothetical protein